PKAFAAGAAYLPALDDPRPNLGYHSPEMSRRARSLAVWATLRAYGRSGYRAMVERHLALARTLGTIVDEAPNFELLAPVQLNIVCFRSVPRALAGDEDALNLVNRSLGQAVLDDGRVLRPDHHLRRTRRVPSRHRQPADHRARRAPRRRRHSRTGRAGDQGLSLSRAPATMATCPESVRPDQRSPSSSRPRCRPSAAASTGGWTPRDASSACRTWTRCSGPRRAIPRAT